MLCKSATAPSSPSSQQVAIGDALSCEERHRSGIKSLPWLGAAPFYKLAQQSVDV